MELTIGLIVLFPEPKVRFGFFSILILSISEYLKVNIEPPCSSILICSFITFSIIFPLIISPFFKVITSMFSCPLIDDINKKTLVSASSIKNKDSKKKKNELSKDVAEDLAKKATEKKITKVYFDRGSYRYHGRIKSFAETLRKGGLIF